MIVTLTPNPSLDRTLQLPAFLRGTVNRASGGRLDPGGKGINVSRALAAHGLPTVAVLPLGGPDGERLTSLLAGLGVEVLAVPVAEGVRSNVTVAEPDGTTTKLNEPGPRLTATEVAALRSAVLTAAVPGSWVVACGSLPGGVEDTFYAELLPAVHARGARMVVDTSGPALRAVLAADSPDGYPDLIKPNLEELAEAVGRPLRTLGEVVAAATELHERGVGAVLASLGADGAVLVGRGGAVHGEAALARPRSTVGAGDALLAGFLSRIAAGNTPPTQAPDDAEARAALSAALAWGAAAAALPGSRMPTPEDVAAVAVTVHDRLDPQRLLEGDHQ